jgi:hypothetical protein
MTTEDMKRIEKRASKESGLTEDRVEQLLNELEAVELPPFYKERLQTRVRAASAGTPWQERLRSPGLAWAVAGACIVALVFVISSIYRGSPDLTPLVPSPGVVQSSIEPVMPADNAVVGAEEVEIVAAIYPPIEGGVVRLFVDEMDVTGLAEVTGSYVMYSPSEDFEEGEHIITIEIRDGSGMKIRDASWLFYTLNGDERALNERV